MYSKADLRKLVSSLRNSISSTEKFNMDRVIYEKATQNINFVNSKVIFIYVSYMNEVDTHNIIKYGLSIGKRICVPKILSLKEGMVAIEILRFSELEQSNYGILEPVLGRSKIVEPEDIDMIILPGLAFDTKGGRVGYGGGFYDRFLSRVSFEIPKIALAYSAQIFDSIPMDKHDILIDGVITD